MPEFVHLHVHSDYSLLDGACRLDRLFGHAKKLNMKALAVTDHGNLHALADFSIEAKNAGIKPLLGCELYLVVDHRMTEKPSDRTKQRIYHQGVLARDDEGYANLSKLVSKAHLEGFYYKPRVDVDTLRQYSKGLLGFTSCLQGIIPQTLLKEGYAAARQWMANMVELFGRENYFVELQDHALADQHQIFRDLVRLAREFDVKLVCTNDVHYVERTDSAPHDLLLCIQTGAKVKDADRMRFDNNEFYLKSADEMAALFKEFPEALTNTLQVAEMCNVKLPFGKSRYPVFRQEPTVTLRGLSNPELLKDICLGGLRRRYGVDYHNPAAAPDPALAQTLVERLDYELRIIQQTGFVDYFLIVQDFINWAKRQGISVGPGRGSGAGCLVAYLTGITDIDPIRFKLLFERFLNPERVSPPDFDIDFCMRRREEVIAYVRQKYGQDCVANIVTFGTLGAKAVLRDIARVLDVPYADADKLAKMVPDGPDVTLASAFEKSSELQAALKTNPIYASIFESGKVLEGVVRNTGTHAAGIIIADRPLIELIPLTLQEGQLTTQYAKEPVEKLGLLKMDFLGLKTLTVIDDAERHIRRSGHPDFDVSQAPLDDPATYRLLNEARTIGVFQMESGGMQALCRQFSISNLDEIVALIALYRPGPMDWIPDYIRGKKEPASIKYPHPLLEDVCRETYGVMVYQEQVMEAAKVIAGYSLGGADVLRRAMGKKKPEEMEKQRGIFVAGAKRCHDIDEARATEIFKILEKFAGYGFNKSHSAAYAILTYRTAYLKANYPAQFMAAVLTSELGNSEKLAHFLDECKAMGVPVLGPDVNISREGFAPVVLPGQKPSIRFGLGGIKNVGDQAAQKIIEERERGGPFASVMDFLERLDGKALNRRAIEHLIKAGAFDELGVDRAALLEGLDGALAEIAAQASDRASGQASLFDLLGGGGAGGGASATKATAQRAWPKKEMPIAEKLQFEKDLLGFYVSGHPLESFLELAAEVDTFTSDEWRQLADRQVFRVCGVVGVVEKKISKKDNRPWGIVTLSTRSGACSINVYSETWERVSGLLTPGEVVVITGQAGQRNGEVTLQADSVSRLRTVLPGLVKRITFIIRPDSRAVDFCQTLRDVLEQGSGDTRVQLGWPVNGGLAIADVANSLNWQCEVDGFRKLRGHPACAAANIEVKAPEQPIPRWQRARG